MKKVHMLVKMTKRLTDKGIPNDIENSNKRRWERFKSHSRLQSLTQVTYEGFTMEEFIRNEKAKLNKSLHQLDDFHDTMLSY